MPEPQSRAHVRSIHQAPHKAPAHTACRWQESEHHLFEQGGVVARRFSTRVVKGGRVRAWATVQRGGGPKQPQLRWQVAM